MQSKFRSDGKIWKVICIKKELVNKGKYLIQLKELWNLAKRLILTRNFFGIRSKQRHFLKEYIFNSLLYFKFT